VRALQVYGLPFGMTTQFQRRIGDPMRRFLGNTFAPVLPAYRGAKHGAARAITLCGACGPIHEETDLMVRNPRQASQHLGQINLRQA